MTAYYNEIDPFAAEWLRNLIAAGQIAQGDVDERSIEDVRPDDLRGYTQCHFFAGVGIWSLSLRSAGWCDTRPVWTGSCPCQPFSSAGAGKGVADKRHLFPHWYHLIGERRPPVIFGEQVASKDGLAWLDIVQADLENAGYACGAVDSCSAGFGAPHIRQRQFFAAYDLGLAADRVQYAASDGREQGEAQPIGGSAPCRCGACRMEHSIGAGLEGYRGDGNRSGEPGRNHAHKGRSVAASGASCRLAHNNSHGRGETGKCVASIGCDGVERDSALDGLADRTPERCDSRTGSRDNRQTEQWGAEPPDCGFVGRIERPGPTNGRWSDADWLFGRDGRWRPVEPGTFALAHGYPNRVGRLRAYGNAINAAQATEYILAAEEARLNKSEQHVADDLFGWAAQ